jgi:hypothetical protein
MSVNEWVGTRPRQIVSITLGTLLLLLVQLLGSAGVMATQTGSSPASLDPACIRFDDPNAVVNGEIVYAGFTAYEAALDHAVDAWSPARGFAIAFREATLTGDAVPEDVNLIYRDVEIPGSAFKGVTVTWTNAPATITLNRSTLPPPETTDPLQQKLLRAVVTHETGHALGLGDVPAPGVNIRECGNMLMKRSVDKGGGEFTEPQPADVALYCLRWGGAICGDNPAPLVTPDADQRLSLEPHAVALPALPVAGQPITTYRYLVVTCERLPEGVITPEQVESDDLPADSGSRCVRAPAGVLFHVHRDDGSGEIVLTDRHGEFAFEKPDGIGVEVDMPEGANGNFPSLLGYQPVDIFDRIPASDPACSPAPAEVCDRVYVLVPEPVDHWKTGSEESNEIRSLAAGNPDRPRQVPVSPSH